METEKHCKAITASGEQCRLKAGLSGYCHIHDPEKIAQRQAEEHAREEARQARWNKGARIREVIEVIESVGNAKGGWTTEILHEDEENWRYASVMMERSYLWRLRGGKHESVGFDITVDENRVKIVPQKESLTSNAERELYQLVVSEVNKLGWVEKPKIVTQEEKRKPPSPDPVRLLEHLIKRFPVVVRRLRDRHDNRSTLSIEDEYDVQDLLHALLLTLFDDVRPEEYTPSYAGRSSRIDFILKKEQIVVEVKMAKPALRDKQIGDQLLIDIGRYQSHPDCKTLVCFVYDPGGQVRNPVALENDLSKDTKDVKVRVFVVPH